ncbi:MAG: glycosyltransferase family 2 protein [Patescibacteria group bacterium]
MKKHLLSIIITIYNEEKTVLPLLKKVYSHNVKGILKELIIIESNSTDKSRKIVSVFVRNKKNIRLIFQSKPNGKGSAVREGLKYAKGDIILIQDADLEYDVNDYEKLVRPIIEGKTKFVLGSRHLKHNGKTDWLIRRFKGKERFYAHFMNFGGLFFHTLFNIVYGVHLTDPTTMYKVFKRELLKNVHLEGQYFELDWEIVGKFIRLGYTPLEVPIKYVSRGNSEGKKVKFSRDVVRWIITIFKVRFMPIKNL